MYCRSSGWLSLAVLASLFLAGCSDRPPIKTYTVNKPAPMKPLANPHDAGLPMTPPGQDAGPPPTGEPTDRMLGAIVPRTPQGWFFKLSGPIDAVTAQEALFVDFLKSVKFADDKPEWKLPEGWTTQPGNAFRFATLVIPSEGKPLELTVSALPNTGSDNQNYVLGNINRWRGQLRLPPIDAAKLSSETKTVEIDGIPSTVVNMTGHASNSMRGPFSGAINGN